MIRCATAQDIPRMAEILVFGKRIAYRGYFKDDEFSFNHLRVIDVMKEYQADPHRLADTMLYDDGIVKGMIRMQSIAGYPESIELCDFYVEPAFQGHGIGRALIERSIQDARTLARKEIFLWVIRDNLSARRFYERNGFSSADEERLIECTPVLEKKYVRNL